MVDQTIPGIRVDGQRIDQAQLLPCPFCGSRASLEDVSTSPKSSAVPLWSVMCSNNACTLDAWSTGDDLKAVVAAWNSRAIVDPVLLEALAPFANAQIDERSLDEAFIWEPSIRRRPLITFGDLRRLRAAIAKAVPPTLEGCHGN